MNRRDGIKVKDLDGMHSLMLEIMPKRCDSDVYISAKIDVTNLVDYVNKLKNERGAGRKEMFTEEQKARVKMLRLQDKSYRAIAKDMNCSVATVHKIINEQ